MCVKQVGINIKQTETDQVSQVWISAEELIILTSWHEGVALELSSKCTLGLTRASEGDLLENSAMSEGAI